MPKAEVLLLVPPLEMNCNNPLTANNLPSEQSLYDLVLTWQSQQREADISGGRQNSAVVKACPHTRKIKMSKPETWDAEQKAAVFDLLIRTANTVKNEGSMYRDKRHPSYLVDANLQGAHSSVMRCIIEGMVSRQGSRKAVRHAYPF